MALSAALVAWVYFSPYFALQTLRQAAAEGNTKALKEEVDFPALRESLKEEVRHLSKGTPPNAGEGDAPIAAVGSALFGGLLNVMIVQLVTPQTIVTMVQGKRVEGAPNLVTSILDRYFHQGLKNDDHARVSSEYESYRRFVVRIFSPQSNDHVALVFLRSDFVTWRLSGIRFPDLQDPTPTIASKDSSAVQTGQRTSHSGSTGNRCLPYAPEVSRLRGTMVQQTFPGPPNYESVEEGDAAETVWLLTLDAPICTVQGDQEQPAENNVSKIQLLLGGEMYEEYRSLLGRSVLVLGGLDHSITGHHHTNVMLQVKDIEP